MPQQPSSLLEEGKLAHEDTQDLEAQNEVNQGAVASEVDEKSAVPAQAANASDDKTYSAFSQFQKGLILLIVALAGIASTLSSSIYFPALTAIQEDFSVTPELINITISLYMVFQALSPSLWGSLADLWGRRPVYLFTMTIYAGANIGLALAPNYTTLIVLRMLQAFGATSVIAIGAGCIGDIASPSQRGLYFGIYSAGPMLGPILGPIIGGVVVRIMNGNYDLCVCKLIDVETYCIQAQKLGWRWIFWLLLILAGAIFILVLFFLPESLRSLVGDGSGYANPTPQQWWKRRVLKKGTTENLKSHTGERSRWLQKPKVLQPFIYLFQPDVALCLLIMGIPYAVFYCVMSSITNLFSGLYNLNELQVGLCYIAIAVGACIGSLTQGKILDRDFKIVAAQHGFDSTTLSRGALPIDFPVFKARFRSAVIPILFFDALIMVYGFLLWKEVPLAGPLVIHFFIGLSQSSLFTSIQTLIVDLYPRNSASISASNNLVRCLLGAASTAAIQPGINAIGVQYMFLVLGLVCFCCNPLLLALVKFGPKWRANRMEREKAESKLHDEQEKNATAAK
ncbi:hypothetical protein INT43_005096 [Umbelopsis isabellina]|uniref:Major facilitator superfamily (MFS) profile domain-containing protein n=1 Tax=Mortierella isabellina TaxID=91625 RepID=A0A8H7U7A7_MORIS|nr:hypothetical protein INT43_005096 [Umbelopsis isabellina]